MMVFNQNTNALINLLPYEGEVIQVGNILNLTEANRYFKILLNTIHWKHDEVKLFGKHIITKRKVAWYGDSEYKYTYSGIERSAALWTPELIELKSLTQEKCKQTFNSCLLNLYENGDQGMSWHSDNEAMLGKQAMIASLSLGADRRFSFKHKRTAYIVNTLLENGSLLLMKGDTQNNWLHSLPKSTKVKMPRINLTFRNIIGN